MTVTAPTIQGREVGRRDWRKIGLAEILCVSIFATGFFAIALIIRNEFSSAPTMGAIELLSRFGAKASDLAMGGLGVVATVQLACFIAIVTGQIVHQDGAEESRLRGMLSVISLAAVTTMGPAVLATSVHSMQSLEDSGLLLVLLPIYGLQLAISTIIGTFEVGDDETLRDFAQKREKSAQDQISHLEKWPTTSRWRITFELGVILFTVATLSAPIVAILLRWFEFPARSGVAPAVITLCMGLSMAIFGLIVTDSQLKRSARTVDVISILFIHFLVAIFYILCLALTTFSFWPIVVPMILLACFFVFSAITSVREGRLVRQGQRPKRRPIPAFDIFGLAGTREALGSARKEKASAQKQVDKYAARIAERDAKHASAKPEPGTTDATAADQATAKTRGSRLSRAFAELIS